MIPRATGRVRGSRRTLWFLALTVPLAVMAYLVCLPLTASTPSSPNQPSLESPNTVTAVAETDAALSSGLADSDRKESYPRIPGGQLVRGRLLASGNGQAVERATIALGSTATLSDPTGRFALETSVITGWCIIEARGYAPRRVPCPSPCPGVWEMGDVELEGLGSLRIRVCEESGQPVSGAGATWREARGPGSVLDPGTVASVPLWDSGPERSKHTDALGLVTVQVPTHAAICVLIRAPDGRLATRGPFLLDLPTSDELEIRLQPTVCLRLVAELGHLAGMVPVVDVQSLSGDPLVSGRFRYSVSRSPFDILVCPGLYRVSAGIPPFPLLLDQICMITRDVTLEVPLARLRVVRLRVLDEKGSPVRLFRAHLMEAPVPGTRMLEGDAVGALFREGETVVGRDGSALLPVAAGSLGSGSDLLQVSVCSPGYAIATERLSGLQADHGEPITVVLKPGSCLRGRASGLPQHARVSLALMSLRKPETEFSSATAPVVDSVPFGQDGSYELRGCGSGVYELRVDLGTRSVPVVEVALPEMGVVERDDALRLGEILVVGRQAGQDLPDSVVDLSGGQEVSLLRRMVVGTRTEQGMLFRFLPSGRYVIGYGDDLRDTFEGSCVGTTSKREGQLQGSLERHLAVSLGPGERRHVTWNGGGEWGPVRVRLEVGETIQGRPLVAAALRSDDVPRWFEKVDWRPVTPDGRVELKAPADGPVSLIVAVSDRSLRKSRGCLPLLATDYPCVAVLEQSLVRVPDPATLQLRTPDPRVRALYIRHVRASRLLTWFQRVVVEGDGQTIAVPAGELEMTTMGIDAGGQGMLRYRWRLHLQPGEVREVVPLIGEDK